MNIRAGVRLLGWALALGAGLALAAAGTASAQSIVYVGADGDLHLTSADGSSKHRVTVDGTPEDEYRSPSQQDDGTVVGIRSAGGGSAIAFFYDRKSGGLKKTWNLPARSGPLSFSPYTGGQISPAGGVMAYDYFYGPGTFDSASIDVGFVGGPGVTNPCTDLHCEDDGSEPRWIPGTNYAAYIETPFSGDVDRIWVQSASGPKSWIGLSDPDAGDLDSFDVSRQNRTLVEVTPDGPPPDGGSERSELGVYANTGVPPSGDVQLLCTAANFAPATARPRWSPDGKMIAWEGADGVYVSPTPTVTNGGACNLKPKLVAPGGERPDWGPAAVPSDGGGGGGGPGGGGGTGGGSPTVELAGAPKLKKILRKGKLKAAVSCPGACQAKVKAVAHKRTAKRFKTGKTLGKGSASSAGAGSFRVTVKLTRKAKKGLKKARKAKLTLKAAITDAGGSTRRVSDRVTLKR